MRNENKNINLDFSSDHGDFSHKFFLLLFFLLGACHINDFWTYFYYFMMNKTIYYPRVSEVERTLRKTRETKELPEKNFCLFPFKSLSFEFVFKSCY